jgi:thioredoxin 1
LAGAIIEVTDVNFQAEVLENEKPVLVDFWAPWCGPCRIVAPHLEELNDEEENLRVVKLNIDDNQETAAKYGIMAIPTMILFKNGEAAHTIQGAMPKKRIREQIAESIA